LASGLTVILMVTTLSGQVDRDRPLQGPAPAAARPKPTPTTLPRTPFQLTQAEQERVDQILKHWERSSDRVKTYRCKFRRWEYDPVFGPPKYAKTLAEGIIKYAKPDKGLFRVDRVGHHTPGREEGALPTYPLKKVEFDEYWICTGKSLFEFKAKKKLLVEYTLPPDQQGKEIVSGPLPFLFGAKADRLKARYWFRELPPPNGAPQYWLEAVPKTRADAADFRKVQIILSQKPFLPIAVQLYLPSIQKQPGQPRMVYQFEDAKVNDPIDQARGFMNSFIRPTPPRGWKKLVENYGQPAADRVSGPDSRREPVHAQHPRAPISR
jgi:TIGR03009 family protein